MHSATVVLLLAAVAATSAQLLNTRPIIPILQHDEVRDDSGQFTLRYVTGDGTTFQESGKLVPNNEGDGNVLVKEGSYSYTSPEGQLISLRYTSDQSGFVPTGDHLPVAPVA
ncbi:endocuticle structural glycoprotein SgAbd-4-like [Ischnura elegans]|uniref:endocuticle structural glycoprotein SgAbd-4-like n=1 Tax=Ischnura elegans TaxID=197161 RepID=UPI001ED87A60|nr:endocuticle structural glycoprotein SgAbd-4-like [Ischnura elegans]